MKEFLTYENIKLIISSACFIAAGILIIDVYIISPIIRKFRKRK